MQKERGNKMPDKGKDSKENGAKPYATKTNATDKEKQPPKPYVWDEKTFSEKMARFRNASAGIVTPKNKPAGPARKTVRIETAKNAGGNNSTQSAPVADNAAPTGVLRVGINLAEIGMDSLSSQVSKTQNLQELYPFLTRRPRRPPEMDLDSMRQWFKERKATLEESKNMMAIRSRALEKQQNMRADETDNSTDESSGSESSDEEHPFDGHDDASIAMALNELHNLGNAPPRERESFLAKVYSRQIAINFMNTRYQGGYELMDMECYGMEMGPSEENLEEQELQPSDNRQLEKESDANRVADSKSGVDVLGSGDLDQEHNKLKDGEERQCKVAFSKNVEHHCRSDELDEICALSNNASSLDKNRTGMDSDKTQESPIRHTTNRAAIDVDSCSTLSVDSESREDSERRRVIPTPHLGENLDASGEESSISNEVKGRALPNTKHRSLMRVTTHEYSNKESEWREAAARQAFVRLYQGMTIDHTFAGIGDMEVYSTCPPTVSSERETTPQPPEQLKPTNKEKKPVELPTKEKVSQDRTLSKESPKEGSIQQSRLNELFQRKRDIERRNAEQQILSSVISGDSTMDKTNSDYLRVQRQLESGEISVAFTISAKSASMEVDRASPQQRVDNARKRQERQRDFNTSCVQPEVCPTTHFEKEEMLGSPQLDEGPRFKEEVYAQDELKTLYHDVTADAVKEVLGGPCLGMESKRERRERPVSKRKVDDLQPTSVNIGKHHRDFQLRGDANRMKKYHVKDSRQSLGETGKVMDRVEDVEQSDLFSTEKARIESSLPEETLIPSPYCGKKSGKVKQNTCTVIEPKVDAKTEYSYSAFNNCTRNAHTPPRDNGLEEFIDNSQSEKLTNVLHELPVIPGNTKYNTTLLNMKQLSHNDYVAPENLESESETSDTKFPLDLTPCPSRLYLGCEANKTESASSEDRRNVDVACCGSASVTGADSRIRKGSEVYQEDDYHSPWRTSSSAEPRRNYTPEEPTGASSNIPKFSKTSKKLLPSVTVGANEEKVRPTAQPPEYCGQSKPKPPSTFKLCGASLKAGIRERLRTLETLDQEKYQSPCSLEPRRCTSETKRTPSACSSEDGKVYVTPKGRPGSSKSKDQIKDTQVTGQSLDYMVAGSKITVGERSSSSKQRKNKPHAPPKAKTHTRDVGTPDLEYDSFTILQGRPSNSPASQIVDSAKHNGGNPFTDLDKNNSNIWECNTEESGPYDTDTEENGYETESCRDQANVPEFKIDFFDVIGDYSIGQEFCDQDNGMCEGVDDSFMLPDCIREPPDLLYGDSPTPPVEIDENVIPKLDLGSICDSSFRDSSMTLACSSQLTFLKPSASFENVNNSSDDENDGASQNRLIMIEKTFGVNERKLRSPSAHKIADEVRNTAANSAGRPEIKVEYDSTCMSYDALKHRALAKSRSATSNALLMWTREKTRRAEVGGYAKDESNGRSVHAVPSYLQAARNRNDNQSNSDCSVALTVSHSESFTSMAKQQDVDNTYIQALPGNRHAADDSNLVGKCKKKCRIPVRKGSNIHARFQKGNSDKQTMNRIFPTTRTTQKITIVSTDGLDKDNPRKVAVVSLGNKEAQYERKHCIEVASNVKLVEKDGDIELQISERKVKTVSAAQLKEEKNVSCDKKPKVAKSDPETAQVGSHLKPPNPASSINKKLQQSTTKAKLSTYT